MKELLEKIKAMQTTFAETRNKDRFNVITALHKERDEVNLHSRIISYLLSPASGHGMGKIYLELFVREILKLDQDKFDVSNVLVIPNEENKTEYKEIDILIVNRFKRQAIVIENKIDAKDSNHDFNTKDGYRGQLERYYNTIKNGKDKDGNECNEYQCNIVYVYYLSLYKEPSDISIGMLANEKQSWDTQKNTLTYGVHLREWLSKCLDETSSDQTLLRNFIKHYSNLIDRMTHNDISQEEKDELRSIVSEHTTEVKYLFDNFKHIKWHTVDLFWQRLKLKLESEKEFFMEVNLFPGPSINNIDFVRAITEITHNNKETNHGIKFRYNNIDLYISGKGKLSYGIVHEKWSNFKSQEIEDINFTLFSSESTYSLINEAGREKAIDLIIKEIKESINIDFDNLIQNCNEAGK